MNVVIIYDIVPIVINSYYTSNPCMTWLWKSFFEMTKYPTDVYAILAPCYMQKPIWSKHNISQH